MPKCDVIVKVERIVRDDETSCHISLCAMRKVKERWGAGAFSLMSLCNPRISKSSTPKGSLSINYSASKCKAIII